MDIVTCRNLHIDLKADVQQTKLTTFYYPHSPSSLLILVSAETAGAPPSQRFCQLEANQEPLRSAHEEILSGNEELQNIHEELSAIDDDRRTRPGEMKATTEDPPNSLGSVDAGVASLDADLAIGLDSRRSGSPPERHQKIGWRRPTRLRPLVRKGWNTDSRWYLLRTRSVRTMESRFAGAVLPVINIHDLASRTLPRPYHAHSESG